MTHERHNHSPDHTNKAQQRNDKTQGSNDANWLDREASDAVDGQGEHFAEGIVALPCHALVTLVVDRSGLEAHEWHHTTKEEVNLFKLGERIKCALAHKAVVGMVVDGLHTH